MTRKNFNDLWNDRIFVEINSIFEHYFQDKEKKEQIKKEVVYLEMLYFFHTKIFKTEAFYMYDPLTIFFKHEDVIYQDIEYNKTLLNKTVFLLNGVYHKEEIRQIIDFYFRIPKKYRLFDLDKSNKKVYFTEKTDIKYDFDREKIYEEILLNKELLNYKHVEKHIINIEDKEKKMGIYNFKDNKENGNSVSKKVGHIIDQKTLEMEHEFELTKLIEERKEKKEHYKDLNNFLPDGNTYKKMGKSFVDRFKELEIYKVDKNRKISKKVSSFEFEEVNHVVAGTGAGKSTLSYGLVKSLCEEGNKKIVFFTNNTINTIQEKNKLEKIGLKVASIIGDSNMENHFNTYLKNVSSERDNPFEIFTENDNVKTLGISCPMLNGLFEEAEKIRKTPPPCKTLWLEGKRQACVCPLYKQCDRHYRFKEMIEADIWIGTPEAFSEGVAKYQWDKYERGFLELAVLWSDLIIIDEVDNIQERLDNLFVKQLGIVIDNPEGVDPTKYFCDYLFGIMPKITKSSTENFSVLFYKNKIGELQSAFDYIYGQLLNEYHMEKYLTDKLFNVFGLLKEWVDANLVTLSGEKLSNDQLFKMYLILKKVYKVYMRKDKKEKTIVKEIKREKNRLFETLYEISTDMLTKEESNEIKIKILNDFISFLEEKFNVVKKEKTNINNRKWSKRLEFILFLFEVEAKIQYLRTRYDYFIQKATLNDSSKFKKDFIFKRDIHKNYMSSAYTDDFLSYRLFSKDGNKENDFKQIVSIEMSEYRGVGRSLLLKMNRIFEGIENQPFPALLFLSATSDIPYATTYGVDIPPNWLIENKNQKEQEITINLVGISKEDGGYYGFSGAEDVKKSFEEATNKMYESGFLEEIWNEGKEKLEKEKLDIIKSSRGKISSKILDNILSETIPCVGLVVKSYKKAEWVAKALLNKGVEKNDLKVLYTSEAKYEGKKIERQEYHVTINQIEMMYKYKPKFFIFVRDALSRGYNVLASKDSHRSLIRNMIFYERPHPIPGDFNEAISMVNSSVDYYKTIVKKQGLSFYEAEKKLQNLAYADLEEIFTSNSAFSNMNAERQKITSSNQYVSTAQTIGRGTRGGTSINIYFLDVKMAPKTFNENSFIFIDEIDKNGNSDSMIAHWKEIMTNHEDELLYRVQKPIIRALKDINIRYL